MRYWAYFAAKLVVAGGILYCSLSLLNPLVPQVAFKTAARRAPLRSPSAGAPVPVVHPEESAKLQVQIELPEDVIGNAGPEVLDKEAKARALAPLTHANQYLALNLAFMLWFLFGAGMLYLIVTDQRFRCRVCLHRLVMPVETGSRGFMLQLGRPRTEYICPYGHGTLRQEQFFTSGLENPEWTASSGDMWEDLYAASKQDRDRA